MRGPVLQFFSSQKIEREERDCENDTKIVALKMGKGKPATVWQRWDSNPRHRNDWSLNPAP